MKKHDVRVLKNGAKRHFSRPALHFFIFLDFLLIFQVPLSSVVFFSFHHFSSFSEALAGETRRSAGQKVSKWRAWTVVPVSGRAGPVDYGGQLGTVGASMAATGGPLAAAVCSGRVGPAVLLLSQSRLRPGGLECPHFWFGVSGVAQLWLN